MIGPTNIYQDSPHALRFPPDSHSLIPYSPTDSFGINPKRFEIVVRPSVRLENMHDDVNEIDDHPIR